MTNHISWEKKHQTENKMTIEQDKKKSQETNIAPQILNFPKLFSVEKTLPQVLNLIYPLHIKFHPSTFGT